MKRKSMLITASILAAGALGTVTAFAATTGSGNSSSSTGSWTVGHKAHTTSSASGASGANSTGAKGSGHKMGRGSGGDFGFGGASITSILGISAQTLKSDLAQGQSLAQIAQSQGIDEQTLISDIESAQKTNLDKVVQNGKMTATQEQTILSKMDSELTKFVEQAGGFSSHQGFGGGVKMAWASELTSIIGIDKATLQADLKNGESILEIAQSKGIDEQTLVSDLEGKLKTRLDTSVQSGKLTQSQEDTILQKFGTNIESMLNHTYTKTSKTETSNS